MFRKNPFIIDRGIVVPSHLVNEHVNNERFAMSDFDIRYDIFGIVVSISALYESLCAYLL